MSRLQGTSLRKGSAYVKHSAVPAWDPAAGNQQGWTSNVATFVSNQAHVSRPLVCIVLEAPKIFSYLEGSDTYLATFKAIMETHSLTITGFNSALTVDVDQHRVGGAGQQQQEVTDVTQEQPTPTHTFVEKYGLPIQRFLDMWIRYGLMDPNTKHPLASILSSPKITHMGPDLYAATCLYFEPDAVFKGVNRAWLVTNMFPLGTGDQTSQRDLGQAQQMLTLDIQFSGLAQTGDGVKLMAQKILEAIRVTHADPQERKAALDGVDTIYQNITGEGYERVVDTLKTETEGRHFDKP